jgi:hypothetical protein
MGNHNFYPLITAFNLEQILMTEKCIICKKKADYKDNTGYYCEKHWRKHK